MIDSMFALTYNRETDPWESTVGLKKTVVERPVIDETKNYHDRGNVLVQPIMTGFCGSDRGIWFRTAFKDMIMKSLDRDKKPMRIIGHELLGRIVALGTDAKRQFGLEIGDIVSTESHIICGACYQCRVGDTHVCADDKIIGISEDGCFAEAVKLPAKSLWRTDITRIRPEVAAVQEPFGNAVHVCTPSVPGQTVANAEMRGKTVAIFGCGTIGLFAILVARALGARRIVGIEPNPRNQERARALGADLVIPPGAGVAGEVKKICDGVGADYALEMSGIPSSLLSALDGSRRGGHVVLFGLSGGDLTIPRFEEVVTAGKHIHAIVGRRVFATWEITRALLEDRRNGIQEKIWKHILDEGNGSILPLGEFTPERFERNLNEFPKTLVAIRPL
ncbi:MAG: alcohol dehydrogenase catalytic domain-containing protein [Bdellovibrionales bacterium]|nr:alcohol dehydrogenase catalytic domain-containing protein [Bdellovibrionales bacterium]